MCVCSFGEIKIYIVKGLNRHLLRKAVGRTCCHVIKTEAILTGPVSFYPVMFRFSNLLRPTPPASTCMLYDPRKAEAAYILIRSRKPLYSLAKE